MNRKIMLTISAAGIFLLMGILIYAEDEKPAVDDAKATAVTACPDCAKLNKDCKPSEAAKLCSECQKKAFSAKPAESAPSSTKTPPSVPSSTKTPDPAPSSTKTPPSAPSSPKPAVKAENDVCK